jgi:hypothetical protein
MIRRLILVGVMVVVERGTILQITLGTVFCAVFLLVQLQSQPFVLASDNYVALSSSFSMLLLFFCSVLYKFDALTSESHVNEAMSSTQKATYITSEVALTFILIASIFGSLVFAALELAVQMTLDARRSKQLRRLRYAKTKKDVVLQPLADPRAFHLFLR